MKNSGRLIKQKLIIQKDRKNEYSCQHGEIKNKTREDLQNPSAFTVTKNMYGKRKKDLNLVIDDTINVY